MVVLTMIEDDIKKNQLLAFQPWDTCKNADHDSSRNHHVHEICSMTTSNNINAASLLA